MEQNNRVVVAGHICLDITPVFASSRKGDKVEDILAPGKLIQMKDADVHTGGAVANTGLAMKVLGARISLMGKIGNDPFGNIIINILKSHGAEKNMLVSEEHTSYSIVLAPPGIDRMFLHNPGANNTFSSKDLNYNEIAKACLFHFGYPTLMTQMYKDNGDELVSIFQKVKQLGVATSLDMTAVDPNSEAGKVDWNKILARVLPHVDFFVPSIEEIGFMLDRKLYAEWTKRASGNDITTVLSISKDIKPLADRLINMGTSMVILKCGAPGIYYKTGSQADLDRLGKSIHLDYTNWGDREGFEKSYIAAQVLSATGAGDTCIAGFLTAMLRGCSLEVSLQIATAAGASCVEAYDALSGLKTFDELLKKINSGWDKSDIIIHN